MWFDKLLDRKVPGLRGLLLVVVLALVGAVLVMQGAQHWRAGERSAERSRLLQQTADTLQAQTTGGSMLGAVSLMGLSEPLLKDMALGRLPPDHPEALSRLAVARGRFLVQGVYVMSADGTVVAHETPGERSTGLNLAFRPYFQQAIQGATSVYAAIGSNTQERGLYYAAPLYESDTPSSNIIGVVMFKVGFEPVDLLLKRAGLPMVLLSPQGVAFAATRPEWQFAVAPPLTQARIDAIRATRQFGRHFDNGVASALPFAADAGEVQINGVPYVVERRAIDWYDPTARAHGYNDNAPLILDEYGRQLPDPVRFPSAAGGKGFGPLAAAVHELGLKLGMHMMRGIPRIAVDKNLPVYGTNYTAKDVADLDHVCKWNPDNYGLNQSHPGAQAWYDAQLDLFASWGLDFLKVDDMQTPFHSDEIAAYHRAIAKAEAKYGRSIDLSLSPGGWVATSYVDFLRENAQMWRISDDLWDRWEDIYQQFARLARWAPFQTTGHWADADMVPFGHIGLRAERGDDRQSRLTLDEQKTLLALWCMGRSPLMVGGDLPTSNSDAIALLQNPALREVLAGSTNNRETVRERIFGKWWDESTYRGEFIVWSADAADWADGTRSAHHGGHYAALFWTGSDTYEIGRNIQLQSIVGLDARNDDWTLADLYADAPGEPADVRLEGVGADRVITGTIPPHGVLWVALDRR